MSVLIKGMKMPASCAGCYMFLHGLTMDGHPWQECAVMERELDDPFGCGKPDWCPIVEINGPHGRLIDADELMRMVDDYLDVVWPEDIEEAPTIIEADCDGRSMSIYIKGMKIPASCYDFNLCRESMDSERNVYWRCAALNAEGAQKYERREDCQLVEVPEHHGRLIDADELMKKRDDRLYVVWAKRIVEAPTIIEAEGDEV